ncbi:lipopolysaccharide assembly protein [Neolewinella xylanilytica]|uniref:Lipopolysaccharide assembly protein n=1 Tax=Neolewinella xylanilytica TaxID=1514080 RepID=A0A2S6I4S9_9BACT|nr:LPS assembly lipoprotein LptE [Neolewinella xylanilytica]PPK86176.1 lipopolysaccharide assembly protein [Neolewinella xylanilytica]
MRILLLAALSLILTACYSFRGISIPEGVERAYVPVFKNNALTAPPTLPLDITEALRDKVRDEARLLITDEQPDIEMRGTLVDFRVSAEGATAADETAAYARLNRLTIVVAIEYINLRDPTAESWKSNFSDYYNFDGSVALASVEEEAIEEILDNINEKIFNRAFAGEW